MRILSQTLEMQEVCNQELNKFIQLIFTNEWCLEEKKELGREDESTDEEEIIAQELSNQEYLIRDLLILLQNYFSQPDTTKTNIASEATKFVCRQMSLLKDYTVE